MCCCVLSDWSDAVIPTCVIVSLCCGVSNANTTVNIVMSVIERYSRSVWLIEKVCHRSLCTSCLVICRTIILFLAKAVTGNLCVLFKGGLGLRGMCSDVAHLNESVSFGSLPTRVLEDLCNFSQRQGAQRLACRHLHYIGVSTGSSGGLFRHFRPWSVKPPRFDAV